MIDVPTDQLKLVEYNTIASSFGPLSWKVGELQEYLAAKHLSNQSEIKINYEPVDLAKIHPMHAKGRVYVDGHIKAYKQAIDYYRETVGRKDADAFVLYVASNDERNLIDQKTTEVEVFKQYGIRSLRISMVELKEGFADGSVTLDE